MPKCRTSLDRLLDLIKTLPPAQIGHAENALRDARRRAEAVIEIDAAAEARACPHCGGAHNVRHGRTRTGIQRWRCLSCGRTWSGLTGTPVAGVRRPDLLVEMLRDMLGDRPRSCRSLAKSLGVSHQTVWRWRMRVLGRLAPPADPVFAGIVEADETFQRESRKGSREWVRHQRDPRHAKPPRLRWWAYGRGGPPKMPGYSPWQMPLLGVADRNGHASVARLANTKHPTIAAALLPLVASDAVLCTDGGAQYGVIARRAKLKHFILYKGRRGPRTPQSHHINTVNGLHAGWKDYANHVWRGPATKNLAGYADWFSALRTAKGDHLPAFRRIIA